MAFVWDPIYALNLVLCIIILVLGIMGYMNTRTKELLLIGLAFGLFGVSHTTFLLGMSKAYATPLIIVRLCAYLLVVYAMFQLAPRKK